MLTKLYGDDVQIIHKLENNGIIPNDYISEWLCFSLFIRDINRKFNRT